MRFSITKYLLGRRSFWSTEPVIYAKNCFQSMPLFTSAAGSHIDEEYGAE
jgi:hypothetical protein